MTISQLYAAGGAAAIWSKYVKYIGAGAIATGGIISLIKSMPLIISTFRDSMKSMKGGSVKGTARTDRDLPMNFHSDRYRCNGSYYLGSTGYSG